MAENVMRRSKRTTSPIQRKTGETSGLAPRVKPVRITVDLDPATHKALKLFAVQTDTDQSAVIRALLAELAERKGLAASVTKRTRASQ